MNAGFSATLVLVFCWWVGVLYVPAVSIWNAYDRVFWPGLPAVGAWLAYGILTIFLWRTYQPALFPWTAAWYDRRQNFNLVGFVLVQTFFLVLFGLQLILVSETTPGFSASIPGVCGGSSCTSKQDVELPYNPNGAFGQGILVSYDNFTHTRCIYDDCAWAGVNWVPVQQYRPFSSENLLPDPSQPCAPTDLGCVATAAAKDYLDWGRGILRGLFLGFGTTAYPSDLTVCPGVYLQGGNLVGRLTCALCLAIHPADPKFAHCGRPQLPKNIDLSWACAICPNLSEKKPPPYIRSQGRSLLMMVLLPLASFLNQELIGQPRWGHAAFAWAVFLALLVIGLTHT